MGVPSAAGLEGVPSGTPSMEVSGADPPIGHARERTPWRANWGVGFRTPQGPQPDPHLTSPGAPGSALPGVPGAVWWGVGLGTFPDATQGTLTGPFR